MKVFDLFVEPANYTLDAIRNVHSKMGIDYAFIFDSSKAGADGHIEVPVLSKMTVVQLVRYVWQTLKKYDALIINGYTNRICLVFILLDIVFFRKPYAIDSDTELRIPKSLLKRVIKKLFLKLVFGRAYAYGFAGGYFEHCKLFTYYGMSQERVIVSPMMVDNAKYRRNEIPDPGAVFRFGYLGRLVPVKQVDRIIEAIVALQDAGIQAELDIVGTGEQEDALRQFSSGRENIRFHGALFGEEKVAMLHRFDALILYSNYEPWGLVVNEALAAGIPCIVSDKVGARNDLILGEKPTGIVVPCNDVNKLIEAMKILATDRKMWRMFSDAAVERMSTWDYEMLREAIRRFKTACEEARKA